MHTGMISPGFSLAVCTEVATQSHLLVNSRNDPPGLASSDWLHETLNLCIEEDKVVFITDKFRMSSKIFLQGLADTGVDHNFLTFAPFLFFDPKSFFWAILPG